MRGRLLLIVVSVVMFLALFATARVKATWTVVSSAEVDSRIQRQLRELASLSGAAVNFSDHVEQNARPRRDTGSLLIQLDSVANASAFLAELKQEARGSEVEPAAELANEGYILRCSYSRGPAPDRIRIASASAIGFHNALLRIPDLLVTPPADLSTKLIPRFQALRQESKGREVIVADYPAFPIRGIVEGFYGPPWSYDDRLDVIRFEGQHGMNIYIYGPKDDPYHRRQWREPYPAEQLRQLGALAAAANENFVNLSFAVSPGLSMVYSSEAEFRALVEKLESVGRLGVTNFALFLDDVPQDLVHPEDRQHFRTLAQAHIYLINRLYERLKSLSPHSRLTVCPTTYTNEWGNREYLRELGAGVNLEIPLDWTGTEVIPRAITAAQAEEWAGYIRRRPLIWDNFPVNDNHPWRLILDPVRGRESGLFAGTQGLFSNPMYQAHASLIPLQTVADYLWNPAAYDPTQSQKHAFTSQYGSDALSYFAPILQIYADNEWSEPALDAIFEEHRSPIHVPEIESQISILNSAVAAMKLHPRFQKLVPEIEPIPAMIREQLDRVLASSAFRRMPNGDIQWDRERHALLATKVAGVPILDGDFSKWESGKVYVLDRSSQLDEGEKLWQGPEQFAARVALGWNQENLYIGVDVVDPHLYQPYWGRGIDKGDAFRLVVNTEKEIRTGRPVGVYDLYLSPGNFGDVKPSIYCDEDFFPPRLRSHDYNLEIRTVWKKTAFGFSGDIAIPASFFEQGKFGPGAEIGLSFGALKTLPPKDSWAEDLDQIVFTSKEDRLFSVEPQNPATLQQMVLVGSLDPE
jgi:hypothetical protein